MLQRFGRRSEMALLAAAATVLAAVGGGYVLGHGNHTTVPTHVLGERFVAEDAQRKPVRDPTEPVVELGQSLFVGARDQREQTLVGEVRQVPASARARHRRIRRRSAQRCHRFGGGGHRCSSPSPSPA